MKIAVVLPDLRGGGAERMHVLMAREWLARGFEVDFVLLRQQGELLRLLPQDLNVVHLGVTRLREVVLPLRAYLKEQLPSVLLAAMWPLTVVALVAARLSGTGVRIAVSDHDTLSMSYSHKGAIHLALLRASMALTYPLADIRIAVSKGVAEDLSNLSGLRPDNFRVIYNPAAAGVTLHGDAKLSELSVDFTGRLILAVGTLKRQKNHALLIEAFSRLAASTDATLCILGEGVMRSELEQLVVQHGLQGRVLLPGFILETGPWYARADLFVLSSDHEGFGNVIVEALEHGVPVVSTDCPSGPREILCDGQYGHLVPAGDPVTLADAMKEVLSASPDPETLKTRARDFSVERIADEYLDVMLPDWRDALSK